MPSCRSTTAAASLSLLAVACGGPVPKATPAATLATFLSSVQAGETGRARSLLVVQERQQPRFDFDQHGLQQGFRLGDSQQDGERAVVLVTQAGGARPMRYVLRREHDEWRVCMTDMLKESFGFDAQKLRQQLEAGVQQAAANKEQRTRDAQHQAAAPPK